MLALVQIAVSMCFAFAAGIFTVLSLVEKPVWPLMRDAQGSGVADEMVRTVHAQLKRLITLLPPAMKTTMASGAVLLGLQGWLRGWDGASLFVLAVFAIGIGYLLVHLQKRIRAVADIPSDGDIAAVRKGTGELAALHHAGLSTAVAVLIAEVLILLA